MKESLIYLLILVYTDPGAAKPTVNITVLPDQVACEQSRVAVQKGSVVPLLVCQCAPIDLKKVEEMRKAHR